MNRARLIQGVLAAGARPLLGPPVPIAAQRLLLATGSLAARLPGGVQVHRSALAGRRAERLTPPAGVDGRAVLLLHGGAFQTCSPRTHRVLAAHVALAAGCAVWVLDYRLAPEHPHPAALNDARAAFDVLSAQASVSVLGDSAGGTLALLLARTRTPARLALISPLVDLTLASSRAWTGRDPLLTDRWLAQGTAGFLAGADPRTFQVTTRGLPPLLVHVSEHERLRPEGERLVADVRAAGGSAEVDMLPGLWHDAHLFAHVLPQAARACARIGAFLARN